MAPEDMLDLVNLATLKKLLRKIGLDLMAYGVIKHTGLGETITEQEKAELMGLARYCGIMGNIQKALKTPYPGQNKIVAPPSVVVPPPAPANKPVGQTNLPFIPNILIQAWRRYYDEVYNLTVNMSKVKFPAMLRPHNFGWTVVVAEELGALPLNMVIEACKKDFPPVWTYVPNDDLQVIITRNDRDPRTIGSYAVFCRGNDSADRENSDLSAEDIKSSGIITMTLLERMILESYVYWGRNKHLDEIDNGQQITTLCSGSRDRKGNVPCCEYINNRFLVGCTDSRDSDPRLRARTVIF